MIKTKIDLKDICPHIKPNEKHDNVEMLTYMVAYAIVNFVEEECSGLDGLNGKLKDHIEYTQKKFIENTKFSIDEANALIPQISKWQKIKELYIDWTEVIPKLKEESEKLLREWSNERDTKGNFFDIINVRDKDISERCEFLRIAFRAKEEELLAKTQNFLHGVIDVRECLWT